MCRGEFCQGPCCKIGYTGVGSLCIFLLGWRVLLFIQEVEGSTMGLVVVEVVGCKFQCRG